VPIVNPYRGTARDEASNSSAVVHNELLRESDEVNVTVPARKTVSVDLTVGRADINLRYSATVKIKCTNGSELVFLEKNSV
jgi:hypothetical protein